MVGAILILVTGAGGQLARRIVAHLRTAGTPVVPAGRNLAEGGRRMDFDLPDTIDLTGVSTLVLVSAGYAEDDIVTRRHASVIEAARRHGVSQVIYTSLIGAGDHLAFALAHRATERQLRNSGLSWTILRNGLYAELIGGLLSGDQGVLLSPFDNGRVAAPTRDDLAVAAARVAIGAAEHAGRTYELTGPPFSAADIAAELGAGVRRLSLGEYRDHLLNTPGMLPFQPPMLASIASSVRHGFLGEHGPDLEALLGRSPDLGLPAAVETARSVTSPDRE